MNAVFDLAFGLVFVCLGAKTDEEANGFVGLQVEECIKTFGEFLNEGLDIGGFKGMIQ